MSQAMCVVSQANENRAKNKSDGQFRKKSNKSQKNCFNMRVALT